MERNQAYPFSSLVQGFSRALSLFSSGAILYTTARNTAWARLPGDQALQNVGLTLASSAENVLRGRLGVQPCWTQWIIEGRDNADNS